MASQQASLADTALLGHDSIPQRDASARSKPFDFLRAADAPNIGVLLSGQHPQIIAMVLAHIETRAAASALSAIPASARPDIVARVAEIAPISPWVTTLTESYIADRLRGMGAWELQPVGGVEGASALLNYSSRGVEAEVIRALDERNPQLAESIKRSMFVFEDLTILDPKDLRTVLAECGVEDIAVALKTADEAVRSVFLDTLEAGRLAEVTQCIEELGRLRLTEIDAAQKRIVETTRQLDLAGQIDVARPEERA
jgi:flagellar motor switch protein FliG